MARGAVFLDYDGTLADRMQGVPYPTEGTRRAIEALGRRDWLAVLCTGRPLSYIPLEALTLPWGGFITANGAYAELGGEPLFDHRIGRALAEPLAARCESLGVSYVLEGQSACYYRELGPAFRGYLEHFAIPTRDYFPMDEMRGWQVNKLNLMYDRPEQLAKVSHGFEDRFIFAPSRDFTCCDVTLRGIDKGTGIREFVARLQIPREATYAVGDGSNDVGMLQSVGTGIAMRRHSPMLDGVAAYVTDGVEQDGVAAALYHFGLI